jgi:hypothetical protein
MALAGKTFYASLKQRRAIAMSDDPTILYDLGLGPVIAYEETLENGSRITGSIRIVGDAFAHLYDVRRGVLGYEDQNVVRVGEWRKYHPDGRIAWTVPYKASSCIPKPIEQREII